MFVPHIFLIKKYLTLIGFIISLFEDASVIMCFSVLACFVTIMKYQRQADFIKKKRFLSFTVVGFHRHGAGSSLSLVRTSWWRWNVYGVGKVCREMTLPNRKLESNSGVVLVLIKTLLYSRAQGFPKSYLKPFGGQLPQEPKDLLVSPIS